MLVWCLRGLVAIEGAAGWDRPGCAAGHRELTDCPPGTSSAPFGRNRRGVTRTVP